MASGLPTLEIFLCKEQQLSKPLLTHLRRCPSGGSEGLHEIWVDLQSVLGESSNQILMGLDLDHPDRLSCGRHSMVLGIHSVGLIRHIGVPCFQGSTRLCVPKNSGKTRTCQGPFAQPLLSYFVRVPSVFGLISSHGYHKWSCVFFQTPLFSAFFQTPPPPHPPPRISRTLGPQPQEVQGRDQPPGVQGGDAGLFEARLRAPFGFSWSRNARFGTALDSDRKRFVLGMNRLGMFPKGNNQLDSWMVECEKSFQLVP